VAGFEYVYASERFTKSHGILLSTHIAISL